MTGKSSWTALRNNRILLQETKWPGTGWRSDIFNKFKARFKNKINCTVFKFETNLSWTTRISIRCMVPHLLKCFLIPNRLWRTNWFLRTPWSLPVAILNAVPDPPETQETGQLIRRNTTLLRCHLKVDVSTVNPYCQILENSSRNFSKIFIFRVMTWKTHPTFFRNFNFGIVS